jgi:hypothetical protein
MTVLTFLPCKVPVQSFLNRFLPTHHLSQDTFIVFNKHIHPSVSSYSIINIHQREPLLKAFIVVEGIIPTDFHDIPHRDIPLLVNVQNFLHFLQASNLLAHGLIRVYSTIKFSILDIGIAIVCHLFLQVSV